MELPGDFYLALPGETSLLFTTLRAIGCKVDWTTSAEAAPVVYTIEFKTFVTSVTFSGDLITEEGNGLANGILAADALCMADANYPGSGTYKALVVDDTNRIACTTGNCSGGSSEHTDWVLKPNSNYYRSDGTTLIMTSDANGIYDFSGGDLTNSFDTTSSRYWTGLSLDWTTVTSHCVSWTDGTISFNSRTGDGSYITYFAIWVSTDTCQNNRYLVCVEQ